MPPKKPPTRRSKVAYIKRIVGYKLWKLSDDELDQHYEDAKQTQRELAADARARKAEEQK